MLKQHAFRVLSSENGYPRGDGFVGYVGRKSEGRDDSPEFYISIHPSDLEAGWNAVKDILQDESGIISYGCLCVGSEDKSPPRGTRGKELVITAKPGTTISDTRMKGILLTCWAALKRAKVPGVGYVLSDKPWQPAVCVTPFSASRDSHISTITAEDLRKHNLTFEDARQMQQQQIASAKTRQDLLWDSINKQMDKLQEEKDNRTGREKLRTALDSISQQISELARKDIEEAATEVKAATVEEAVASSAPAKKKGAILNEELFHTVMAQIPLAAKKRRTDFKAAWTKAVAEENRENLAKEVAMLQSLFMDDRAAPVVVQDTLAISPVEQQDADNKTRADLIKDLLEGDETKSARVYLGAWGKDISAWAEKSPVQFRQLCSTIHSYDRNRQLLGRAETEASTLNRLGSWFKNNRFFTTSIALLIAAVGVAFPPFIPLAFIPLLAVAISPTLRTMVEAHPYRAGLFILGIGLSIMSGPLLLFTGALAKLQTVSFFVDLINYFSNPGIFSEAAPAAVAAFSTAVCVGAAALVGLGRLAWMLVKNCCKSAPSSTPAVARESNVVREMDLVSVGSINPQGATGPVVSSVSKPYLYTDEEDKSVGKLRVVVSGAGNLTHSATFSRTPRPEDDTLQPLLSAEASGSAFPSFGYGTTEQ